jgi:uncharacterized hydrophobic protein (TIGR00341 family)
MSQRKVEIFLHTNQKESLTEFLAKNEITDIWVSALDDQMILCGLMTRAEEAEDLIDRLEKKYDDTPGFRIILSPVEAVIPRREDPVEPPNEEAQPKKPKNKILLLRISRAELYDDITAFSEMNRNFIIMVVLSSVVAGVGILTENVAVIVGAMVIAPLLGPNIALAFGTVLGDIPLVKKSALTGGVATLIALIISFAWGMFYSAELGDMHIAGIQLSDILLAFVSGAAGAVTILRGGSSSLVGVMVAVALLPPLMKTGLYAGGGYWVNSMHAFLVFLGNTICVNLAGILTFIIAGITPIYWWEEKKAKKYSRNAMIVWTLLLLFMVVVVILLNIYN